jgi:hypothetical protein
MLTPEELLVAKTTFDSIFRSCGGYRVEPIGATYDRTILHMAAEYVAYLSWRAIRSHRHYRNKQLNLRRHLSTYYKADYALAALLRLMGMEELRTASPQTLRVIKRFLEIDL